MFCFKFYFPYQNDAGLTAAALRNPRRPSLPFGVQPLPSVSPSMRLSVRRHQSLRSCCSSAWRASLSAPSRPHPLRNVSAVRRTKRRHDSGLQWWVVWVVWERGRGDSAGRGDLLMGPSTSVLAAAGVFFCRQPCQNSAPGPIQLRPTTFPSRPCDATVGSGGSKQPDVTSVQVVTLMEGTPPLYVFVTRQAATPTSGCVPLPGRGRCGRRRIVKDNRKKKKKEKIEAIHHLCRAEMFGGGSL